MTIGDRLYFDASFVYPIKNHPDAPFTDQIGNVLRQAYLHAQLASWLLISQSYGFDLIQAENDWSIKRSFKVFIPAGVARGYAEIPREATHLRASIFFAVHGSGGTADVTHDIFVSGSPDTNSQVFVTDVIVDPGRAAQNDQAWMQADFPFTDRWRTYRADVEVAITSALPATREIRVNAVAVSTDIGQSVEYQPLYVSVWWEHRG